MVRMNFHEDSEINILSIDNKIKQNFKKTKNDLEIYKNRLHELETTKKSQKLSIRSRKEIDKNIEELENIIYEIEHEEKLNYHIAETAEILEKYKSILETPVKMSFTGRSKTDEKEKNNLVEEYLRIVSAYYIADINIATKKQVLISCETCGNKEFATEENISVCVTCGREYIMQHYATSYKDVERVNISTKYTYDRKVHFRDCINQYQGRQNCTINQKVYDSLEDILEKHHLLIGDKNTQKDIRFSKVTKEHILMFLKELKYAKHYENVTLIHFNMTGKKPDDISHLEDSLMHDFDILVDTYDRHFKHKIDRVNFISTQYVLYQLLQKHHHCCKKEDFVILKTMDRKSFHDDICRELFALVGWNHTPMF